MASVFSSALLREVTIPKGGTLARLRISLAYWWRHGRLPNLDTPRTFTEWVQWRKLNERSLALAALTDKAIAKAHVAARLGERWIVPTLWQGRLAPTKPPWPTPFVIKARHGCKQYAIVRDVARDWPSALARTRRWTKGTYGGWLDEWGYSKNQPGLIVEPFVGDGEEPPNDYKIYVFNGIAEVVQVHTDRLTDHRWIQYDRDWNRISAGADLPSPKGLMAMLAAAETLAQGHDFLRVDFYDIPGQPLFGEFCLYPGSGFDPFDPVALDEHLGVKWRDARAALSKD